MTCSFCVPAWVLLQIRMAVLRRRPFCRCPEDRASAVCCHELAPGIARCCEWQQWGNRPQTVGATPPFPGYRAERLWGPQV